jgi:hypothetical protein
LRTAEDSRPHHNYKRDQWRDEARHSERCPARVRD